jgi:hypothetical protein
MEEGMEKNVLKNAGFSRLVFAVLAVLIAAGSCGGSLLNDGFADDWEEADKNVRIPLPASGRSLTLESQVKAMVDYYEVIFYDGTSEYYRGVASGGQRYLSVNIPVGTGYKVLLLAGNSTYGTLLATAYKGAVDIDLGRNEVSMAINPVIIYPSVSGVPGVITITSPSSTTIETSTKNKYRYFAIEKNDAVTVSVTLNAVTSTAFKDLVDAEGATVFTIVSSPKSNILKMKTYDSSPGFPDIIESSTDTTINPSAAFTYVIPSTLTALDATYLLSFEMKYQAFGTSASEGRIWYITNGLNPSQVDVANTIGGGILMAVGDSSVADITSNW